MPYSFARRWFARAAFAALLAAWAGSISLAHAAPATIQPGTVFVSSALTDVARALSIDFNRRTGKVVTLKFGSSAGLSRDLEGGAAAEMIITADSAWMDYLVRKKVIERRNRRDLIGSRMVLVAATPPRTPLRIAKGMPLAAALGAAGKLAMANPGTVPAGGAARAALQWSDAWSAVRARVRNTNTTREAVSLVANGETQFGVVPENDARLETRVRVLGAFPAEAHPKLVYPLAMTRHAGERGNAFLAYLQSREAAALLARFGYVTY